MSITVEKTRANKHRLERLAIMQANPDDPRHGTWYGYSTGCRCDKCMAAAKEYRKRYGSSYTKKSYLKAYYEMQDDPADIRHGTAYGYKCGCRCELCRNAKKKEAAKYERRRKQRSDLVG